MKVGIKEYFVMINYKTRQQLLCSWFDNEPDFFGRKVYYIGLTNGLGGYNKLIEQGFIDRRFRRFILPNKVQTYFFEKFLKQLRSK